jgi:outer membrane biogenesis lipoprotein LolB
VAVYQEKKVPAPAIIAAAILIETAILWLISCHPGTPRFSPLPPQVISIEGYASLRLTSGGETAKSRFSFVFVLPDRGRIEVYGPLGRTVSILFLMSLEEAFLVLPSKRVYWRTEQEEALAKLLGFDLRLKEITNILSGQAEELSGWALERDSQGRIIRGRREALRFEVRQFFGQSALPQLLAIFHGEEKGSLKIMRLNFNQPLKSAAFELSFLQDKDYKPSTWAEIEKWLRDEN